MGIFLEYGKAGLWMAPLILLGLLLLPQLLKRYTARLPYVVWLVLAVRLLIPWNLTLPQEIAPLYVEISQKEMMQWMPVAKGSGNVPAAIEGDIAPVALPEQGAEPIKQPRTPLAGMQVIFALWLSGVAASMLYTMLSTLRMKRLLRRWEREPAQETAVFYRETAGEKRPPLAICPALETPMAVGLFWTKIYLPHESYTRQEMEMIFRHELIHWQRRDLWYKFLLLLVRSIHWYNPLVWLMAKRANKDLEISCDGEAVQGKDAAYRKAYSLMILQVAEHSLQKQAALTTCFTDGKKALQERLVEILNGEKRKRGMALVAMALALALTCGCMVSYGGTDDMETVEKNTALTTEQQEIVELWAEALSHRDGKIRYDHMGEKAKAQFIEEQKGRYDGEEWDYNIGGSSPWVISYAVEDKENAVIITYTMQDSIPQQYTMKELLKFGEENGRTVVESYLTSNLYWEDGKVYPVTGKRGMELDEGIWDFLYQSVEGFISQSSWQIYELEEFNFNIIHVERKRLANGRDEVTVDFGLQIIHRNRFADPAETPYLKKLKEQGSKEYDILYQEYYQQQESNSYMRFTCEVLPGEGRIYEDTCYPETFRLYNDDFHPRKIIFENKNPAYDGYYEVEPKDGWHCTFQTISDGEILAAERKILITDHSGRTNNGYFILDLGYGANLTVAEDAEIYIGGDGKGLQKISVEEWKKMLLEDTMVTGRQRIFTTWFREKADGNFEIVEAKEGFWQ